MVVVTDNHVYFRDMKLYISNTAFFTEEDYNKYYSMMSEERKAYIDRKRFFDSKRESVIGEMLARKGICELTGIKETDIVFFRTESGKPYAENADAFFSVSHSNDYVICAVDDNEIGADIEQIRQIEPRITNISCTESDKEYIYGDSEPDMFTSDMIERFFEAWTAKEAYLKFKGTGMIDVKTISYEDIKPFCKKIEDSGYIITIYSKRDFHGLNLKIV